MLYCGVLIPRSRIQCDAPIQPLESSANSGLEGRLNLTVISLDVSIK